MEQKYNFEVDLKPILKGQKTEIDKNIKLLEKILFAKIKKCQRNNQTEIAETISFFLFQIKNSENYKEKYLDLLLTVKNVFNLPESFDSIGNINFHNDKIYDLLSTLLLELEFNWDLEKRLENSVVKNPSPLEIILANGVREWNSEMEVKEI